MKIRTGRRFWLRKTVAVLLCLIAGLGAVTTKAYASGSSIELTAAVITYTGGSIKFPNDNVTVSGAAPGYVVHYSYSNDISLGETPRFAENNYPTYCGTYLVAARLCDEDGTEIANSGNAVSMRIVPRSVTIEASSKEKPYDGAALTDDGYTLQGYLGIGDVLTGITIVGSQTIIGSSTNRIIDASITKGTVDVSDNYDFNFVDGVLKVTGAATTVKLEDKTVEYTGSPIAINPATVTGSGAAPTYYYYSDAALTKKLSTPPKDVGTYYVKAVVPADASHGAGENEQAAKLKITQITATLTADDAEKTWDGTPLTSDEWHVTGVLAGHFVTDVTLTGSQSGVGSSQVVPSDATIKDGNNVDVTANYKITYVPGTLLVTKTGYSIVVPDKTVVYDGTAVKSDAATVENAKSPWNPSELKYFYYDSNYKALPAGTFPTEAGTYHVVVTWTDPSGASTLPNGTATINIIKRGASGQDPKNPLPAVSINAPSGEKAYDGTPLVKDSVADCTAVNLAPGHKLGNATVISGTQTECGESSNTFTSIVIVDADGRDVTGNYVIDSNNTGVLKVTTATPQVKLEPMTEIYSGKPVSIHPAAVTVPVNGEKIKPEDVVYRYYKDLNCMQPCNQANPSVPPTSAGIYYVTSTTPASNNYASVTSAPAQLRITLRPITITTGTKTELDAGKPLTEDSYSIEGTLAEGDTVADIQINGVQNGVGTSKNAADKSSVIIKNGQAADVTGNYDITIVEGDLTLYNTIGILGTPGAAADSGIPTGSATTGSADIPQTGDAANPDLWIILLILSMIGLCIGTLYILGSLIRKHKSA